MDEGFLRRVYWMSLVLAPLVALAGAAYLGWLWGITFLIAGIWAVANFWALAALLRLRMEGGRPLAMGGIFFLKVGILYGFMVAYFTLAPIDFGALVGGVSLPLVVIVLKAIGQFLTENDEIRGGFRDSKTEDRENKHKNGRTRNHNRGADRKRTG